MAEIKSTLELVMERTRHLHMTEEDKRKQALETYLEAVGRLTRKYFDGQINLGRFQSELKGLEAQGSPDRAVAAAEIGKRIDPAADNTLLLDLLKHGMEFDTSSIEDLLRHFRETVHVKEGREAERIRTYLLEQGISGSAVIPNLEADEDWAARRSEMFETVREELAAQIAKIKNY